MPDGINNENRDHTVFPSSGTDADGGGSSNFVMHGRRRAGKKQLKKPEAPAEPVQLKLSSVAQQYAAELERDDQSPPPPPPLPPPKAENSSNAAGSSSKPGKSINIRI